MNEPADIWKIRPEGHPEHLPWPPKAREYPADHPARSDEESKNSFNEDWAREDFGIAFVEHLREQQGTRIFAGDWWHFAFLRRLENVALQRDPHGAQQDRFLVWNNYAFLMMMNGVWLHFEYASFRNANLQHSELFGAHLEHASFEDAHLEHAKLRDAELLHADLGSAHLKHANFVATSLKHADFTSTDVRDAIGIHFDQSPVRDLRIEGDAPDPWSVLRRSYTGPWFFVHAALLVLFVLPYVGRVMVLGAAGTLTTQGGAWAEQVPAPSDGTPAPSAATPALGGGSVGTGPEAPGARRETPRAETNAVGAMPDAPRTDALHAGTSSLRAGTTPLRAGTSTLRAGTSGDAPAHGSRAPGPTGVTEASDGSVPPFRGDDGVTEGGAPASVSERLDNAIGGGLGGRADRAGALRERVAAVPRVPAWHILIGLDRGWWFPAFAALLVVFNAIRAFLTIQVGMLRDAEERSGITPALKEYMPLFRWHRVARVLALIALAIVLYNTWYWLTHTEVPDPRALAEALGG